MGIPSMLSPAVTRGPVARAEALHQARGAPAARWRRWLSRAIRLLALTLAGILFGAEFAGSLLQRYAGTVETALGFAPQALAVFTLALHFRLMFRTLSRSVHSIAREQHGRTWDMLVLTGQDARQIVLGKWWATVRGLAADYLVLGALRTAVIVWMASSFGRVMLVIYAGTYATPYANPLTPPETRLPGPALYLLAGALVIGLTLANLGLTAACGLLASAAGRSSSLALALAAAIRTGLLTGAALLILLPYGAARLTFLLFDLNLTGLDDIVPRLTATLVDNGVTLGGELVAYRFFNEPTTTRSVIAAGLVALAVYGLFTWALLAGAERRAVRRMALPPRRA